MDKFVSALRILMGKGVLRNANAKELLDKADDNAGKKSRQILAEVSDLFSELFEQEISAEEMDSLVKLLIEFNLMPRGMLSEKAILHPSISFNGGNLTLTDMMSVKDSYNEEYNFILGGEPSNRVYKIVYCYDCEGLNITFSNYVYGYLDWGRLKYLNVEDALSRYAIEKALVTSCGFIGRMSCDNCLGDNLLYSGKRASEKEEQEMFNKFKRKHDAYAELYRGDDTIEVLKVGDMKISDSYNRINNRLSQYLIKVSNDADTTTYLVYGDIKTSFLKFSLEYANDVANILLSEQNLNDSCYIGYINNGKLIKPNIMPSINEIIKNYSIN